jgi:hypothetical protein
VRCGVAVGRQDLASVGGVLTSRNSWRADGVCVALGVTISTTGGEGDHPIVEGHRSDTRGWPQEPVAMAA